LQFRNRIQYFIGTHDEKRFPLPFDMGVELE